MGTGNFVGNQNNNITIYVTKLYNEAKYLEPPIPFKSFVRHVSKHLPREFQVTLMTKEINDMNELERILDVLQSIRDREGGRRHQPPNNNYEYNNTRDNPSRYGGTRIDNSNNQEDWTCSRCRRENYASRQKCYRCGQAREDPRRRGGSIQHVQQQRGMQALGEQLGITMDQLPVVPIETERKTRDDSGNKDQTTVQGSE